MINYYCPDCGALLLEVSYPWFNCSGCNKDWEEDPCSGELMELKPKPLPKHPSPEVMSRKFTI